MKRILFFTLLALIITVFIRTAALSPSAESGLPLPSLAEINADSAASRLAQAVRFKTISYYDTSKTDFKEFKRFQAFLEHRFPNVWNTFAIERVNGYTLLLKWRGSDEALNPALLMAHQDVVPISTGSESDWAHPPFAGVIENGTVFGRGSIDDKSSLMGLLEAAEILIKQGKSPKRTLYFAFGHDEEIGGRSGILKVVELLKSRQIELEFVLDEGMLILDNVVSVIDGKFAAIGLAEKGYVSLRLTAMHAGGHSSMPPSGAAIATLSAAILALEENPMPANMAFLEEFILNLGDKIPYSQRLIFSNLWLFRPIAEAIVSADPKLNTLIRTTTAPTILRAGEKDNVMPINAEAVVNFRILPGESVASVIKFVNKTINNNAVAVEVYKHTDEPSPISSDKTATFQQLKAAAKAIMGGADAPVTPALVIAGTDSKHFSPIAKNVYRFQPLSLDAEGVESIHGTDEKVRIESYVGMIQFYISFIEMSFF